MNKLNIELTAVKYAAFASEETNCYEAIVLIDGEKAIHASNEGHGGCDYLRDLIPGSVQRLEAYAATLPPIVFHGQSLTNSAELVIGDLFAEWQMRRDMKRALGKTVHFTRTDKAGIFLLPKAKWTSATETAIRAHLERSRTLGKILNELPEDEALAIWTAVAK